MLLYYYMEALIIWKELAFSLRIAWYSVAKDFNLSYTDINTDIVFGEYDPSACPGRTMYQHDSHVI